jgi:hypothetical protein
MKINGRSPPAVREGEQPAREVSRLLNKISNQLELFADTKIKQITAMKIYSDINILLRLAVYLL